MSAGKVNGLAADQTMNSHIISEPEISRETSEEVQPTMARGTQNSLSKFSQIMTIVGTIVMIMSPFIIWQVVQRDTVRDLTTKVSTLEVQVQAFVDMPTKQDIQNLTEEIKKNNSIYFEPVSPSSRRTGARVYVPQNYADRNRSNQPFPSR